MPLSYDGTIETLHQALTKHGLRGSWECEPNGGFMFRVEDGANLHWSSRTKRLWFSGDTVLQFRLANLVTKFRGATGRG